MFHPFEGSPSVHIFARVAQEREKRIRAEALADAQTIANLRGASLAEMVCRAEDEETISNLRAYIKQRGEKFSDKHIETN